MNSRTPLDGLEEKVMRYVEEKRLLVPGERVLAGVSGGADSVCLLFVLLAVSECFADNPLHIEVVHVHHMIRGKEADEDAAFVEELCRRLNLVFHPVKKPVEQIAKELGYSVEEAGRRVRYEAFEAICRERRLDKIAVAHHRDDNAETILMNLLRGSGLRGVSGIAPHRDRVVRPLLDVSRKEIEDYLSKKGMVYRNDSTNRDCLYTRNRIRNQLIPYVEEQINPQAVKHLVEFGMLAGEIDVYFQKKANLLYERYAKTEENRAILCVDCLQEDSTEVSYLIRKLLRGLAPGLKDIGREHIEQVFRVLAGRTGGKCRLPGGILVEKSYQQCTFYPEEAYRKEPGGKADTDCMPEAGVVDIRLEDLEENIPWQTELAGTKFTFTIRNIKKNETFPKKKYTKWFDCGKIKFTLQLRTRRKGDFLVVTAAGGRKKLKDYFIDNKIPRKEREERILLTEGPEILWIPGMRISERYKMEEHTTRILEVCMEQED